MLDVPAVGLEALALVLGVEGEGGGTVDGDAVVVVDVDELAETVLARDGGRFASDALHQVAVGADGVDVVIDYLVPDPVVSARKETLSQRHPDAVGEALSQGTGRRLDAGGEEVLRVARRPRFPLPEVLDVLH